MAGPELHRHAAGPEAEDEVSKLGEYRLVEELDLPRDANASDPRFMCAWCACAASSMAHVEAHALVC